MGALAPRPVCRLVCGPVCRLLCAETRTPSRPHRAARAEPPAPSGLHRAACAGRRLRPRQLHAHASHARDSHAHASHARARHTHASHALTPATPMLATR